MPAAPAVAALRPIQADDSVQSTSGKRGVQSPHSAERHVRKRA